MLRETAASALIPPPDRRLHVEETALTEDPQGERLSDGMSVGAAR